LIGRPIGDLLPAGKWGSGEAGMTGAGRRIPFAGLFASAGKAPADKREMDWRRAMSDHVAYALLVYTSLQIFMTMGAFRSQDGSLMPYLALIVLVIAIIPACRRFEERWSRLSDTEAASPEFGHQFRRDRLALWLLAIGLPLLLTGMFKALATLIS